MTDHGGDVLAEKLADAEKVGHDRAAEVVAVGDKVLTAVGITREVTEVATLLPHVESWRCPKCSCLVGRYEYFNASLDFNIMQSWTVHIPEHLLVTCSRCQYEERMQPADTVAG